MSDITNKLLEQLSAVLTSMTDAIGKAKDFTLEQLPDICRQFLTFELVWNWVVAVGLFTALAVLATTWWRTFTPYIINYKRREDDDSFFVAYCIRAVGTAVLIAALGIPFGNYLRDAIMVSVAPKVYLIKRVTEMAKDMIKPEPEPRK